MLIKQHIGASTSTVEIDDIVFQHQHNLSHPLTQLPVRSRGVCQFRSRIKVLHLSRFCVSCFTSLMPRLLRLLRAPLMLSIHLSRGLPRGILPCGVQSNKRLTDLEGGILWMWPYRRSCCFSFLCLTDY